MSLQFRRKIRFDFDVDKQPVFIITKLILAVPKQNQISQLTEEKLFKRYVNCWHYLTKNKIIIKKFKFKERKKLTQWF